MNIGIMGTGYVTQALVEGWTGVGYSVALGSREPGSKASLRRHAELEEISYFVAFLVSESASYITGSTVDINGGL